MRVRMPDGVIIDNVPEGISQEELLQMYEGSKKPKEERAEPGSISYAAQGAGAAFESGLRMVAGMAGMGAGALVGGAEALLGNDDRPAGDIIRDRMQAGAEVMTPSKTMFAPTELFDETLGHGFEQVRNVLGAGGEAMELAREAQGRALGLPVPKADVAAGRTAGEYVFDAAGAVAPFSMARGAAQRSRARLTERANAPETPVDQPTTQQQFNPREIVDRAITESETSGRKPVAEDTSVALEIPDSPIARPTESKTTADYIREARERGGSFEGTALTEGERTTAAIKEFRERGGQTVNAEAPKGWDKVEPISQTTVHRLMEEIRKDPPELVEAINRNDFQSALKHIAEKGESTFSRLSARLLQELGTSFKPNVTFRDTYPSELANAVGGSADWAGGYSPKSNLIIFRNQGRSAKLEPLVLHEAVHAAVVSIQYAAEVAVTRRMPISVFGPFNETQARAARNINQLFNDVTAFVNKNKEQIKKEFPNQPYGLLNSREFIAEAFSNKKFQEFLKTINLPHTTESGARGVFTRVSNMWDKFVIAVRDIIGLPASETNALSLALQEGAKLIRSSTKEAREIFSSDPSSLSEQGTREWGGKRTAFEREENLPAGAGLSTPDLKAPLEKRAAETIELGKDMALSKGREFLQNLPNDIGSFFSKYLMNPEQLSKFFGDSNPLIKAVVDRVADKKRYWSGVREDLMKGSKFLSPTGMHAWHGTALRYVKRAKEGFDGIIETLGKNDQESFFKARLEFDQASILAEQGLQWPTREMLIEKGYNQKVVDAYMKEAEYMDAAYDLINWGRQLTGKDPITRIPGYFPHTYKGHMGIKIHKIVESDGAVSKVPVGFTKAEGSRKAITQAAEGLMAQLQKDLEGQNVKLGYEVYRTDKPGSTPDIIDALDTVSQIYNNTDKPLIKLVQKVLQGRMASLEQQFLQASLKRNGVEGWIGSSGVTAKNIEQLAKARSGYMESVIKYAESQDILTTTTEQISTKTWEELNKRLPNTADFISKFVDVAREKFSLAEIDKAMLNLFAEKTGDRFSYRAPLMGLNKLRGFFAAKDLAWSTSYHVGNAIQPEILGSHALAREYSRIGLGDPATAIMLAEKEFISPRLENIRAIEWAAKNKVTTPKLMEEIDFLYSKSGKFAKELGKDVLTGRRASELNEVIGRMRTFIMGLEYYRSVGMTELQSRQAAAKFVDDVMVDYSTAGQPLWLSSNPMGQTAGRMVAPYAAFRHSFWGHTALAIQAIKKNPSMARKILPFVQLQVATATFGGLRGMSFMAEAIVLATMTNAMWEQMFNEPGPIPNPMEALLESENFNGDFALFGALSAATKKIPGLEHGADIGSTVAAPQAMESITPRAIEGTYEALKESMTFFKILFGTATDSEKLRLIKSLTPNFTHGMFEMAFSKSDEVASDERNRMRGSVLRGEEDWRARIFTGKRSLEEQRQILAKNLVRKSELKGRERKSDLTELAADFYEQEGYLDPDHMERAMEEGYRSREFRDRVKEMVRERNKTRLGSMTSTKKRTRTRERIRGQVEELMQDADY